MFFHPFGSLGSEFDASSYRCFQILLAMCGFVLAASSAFGQCGPPQYLCVRTDTSVIPVPSPLPFGGPSGANTIFYDSAFNSDHAPQYVRVTDAKTANNASMLASHAGDDKLWNADDTFFFTKSIGAAVYVFSLNQSTMSTNLVWAPNGSVWDSAAWSQSNRNYLYAFERNNSTGNPTGKLIRWNFSACGAGACTPASAIAFDFAANCGVNPEPFADGAPWSQVTMLGVSGSAASPDTVFGAYFGPQDLGNQVVVFNGRSCFFYNTQYGTIYNYSGSPTVLSGTATCTKGSTIVSGRFDVVGSWAGLNIVVGRRSGYQVAASSRTSLTLRSNYTGKTGRCSYSLKPGMYIGTVTGPDRYYSHGGRLDPSGTWAVIPTNTCLSGTCQTNHMWQVGTATVSIALDRAGHAGGHPAETAYGWINMDANYTAWSAVSMLYRSWANIGATSIPPIVELSSITAAADVGLDTHCSTRNDPEGIHHFPVFCMTWAMNDPSASKFPYSMEIDAWSQNNPPNPIWRFGHTFNSNANAPGYNADLNGGVVSSTGKYYLFTSDGLGTLGNINGARTCSLLAGTCRTDVFILNLVPAQ